MLLEVVHYCTAMYFSGFTKGTLVMVRYGFLESPPGTRSSFGVDRFPVPLVYVNRGDIVQFFIPADGYHICGKDLLREKNPYFFQCRSVPFGKGVVRFSRLLPSIALIFKAYRALYTIKVGR